MVMNVSLQKLNHLRELRKQLKALANKEVLVGIPAENSTREHGGEINNAELLYIQSHGVRSASMRKEMQDNLDSGIKYSKAHELYIHSHGSPMYHVPPRPVLEPAIASQKDAIGKLIGAASKSALEGKPAQCEANLNKAGMVAVSAARGWFENPANGWAPNAPYTIKKKGSSQPLIDTGEMRKAITYVVRDKT